MAECRAGQPVSGEVEVEVDEPYFGARRVKGKGGHGALERVIHSDDRPDYD